MNEQKPGGAKKRATEGKQGDRRRIRRESRKEKKGERRREITKKRKRKVYKNTRKAKTPP